MLVRPPNAPQPVGLVPEPIAVAPGGGPLTVPPAPAPSTVVSQVKPPGVLAADAPQLRALRGLDRPIPLERLELMQKDLRHTPDEMQALRADIEENGLKTPLKVVCFEDGRLFVRDGRHRHQILQDMGVGSLEPSQIAVTFLSYSDFTDVKFRTDAEGKLDLLATWITPFDPRCQQRQQDLEAYKTFIKILFDTGVPLDQLELFIRRHPELYLCDALADHDKQPVQTASDRNWQAYLEWMAQSMPIKIAQLLTIIPHQGVVVDFGSGTGDQSFAYAHYYPDLMVVGLDGSKQAIEHANQNFKAKNLLFQHGDVADSHFPDGAIDAACDSSFLHEIGWPLAQAYFKELMRILKPGGMYGSRDFAAAEWPDKVRIHLPQNPETGPGPYGQLSRAELFKVYAKTLKVGGYTDGVPFVDCGVDEKGWAIFELDARAAQNFLLRMEYRTNWEPEMLEWFPYATLKEKIKALQAAGFMVLAATEVHSTWIYKNWWKNRLYVTDATGKPIDLPPTNCLIYVVKPGPDDPVSYRITDASYGAVPTAMELRHFKGPTTAEPVFDMVHVEDTTQLEIPFYKNEAGRIFVYVEKSRRPALAYYTEQSPYGVYCSGLTNTAFSTMVADNSQESKSEGFELTDACFPLPMMSDEVLSTRFVPLEDADARDAMEAIGARGFELNQLLGSAHVGAIPDGRMEAALYALAIKEGCFFDRWYDGELPHTAQAGEGLDASLGYKALVALKSGQNHFSPTEADGGFVQTARITTEEQYLSGVFGVSDHELLMPKALSPDMHLVVPYYVDKDGEVFVGFEKRALPAFEQKGLAAAQAMIPAWRLTKQIQSDEEANRYVRDRMLGDFDLLTLNVTPLGEGFFPTANTTPEKVTPFAAEVDLNKLPRDLVFVPLREILKETGKITDLSSRIAIYRLAHAFHLLPERKPLQAK